MHSKLKKSIIAGILGTAIMTAVMMIAPIFGMPKMSPPDMLVSMISLPVAIGWIIHFLIGVVFAGTYTFLLSYRLPGKSLLIKGVVFGIATFVFGQIVLGILGTITTMPKMEGSMAMTIFGSILAHIIFGIAVVKIVGSSLCETPTAKN